MWSRRPLGLCLPVGGPHPPPSWCPGAVSMAFWRAGALEPIAPTHRWASGNSGVNPGLARSGAGDEDSDKTTGIPGKVLSLVDPSPKTCRLMLNDGRPREPGVPDREQSSEHIPDWNAVQSSRQGNSGAAGQAWRPCPRWPTASDGAAPAVAAAAGVDPGGDRECAGLGRFWLRADSADRCTGHRAQPTGRDPGGLPTRHHSVGSAGA